MDSKKVALPMIIWNKKVPNTNLEKLKKVIENKYNQHFESYWDLHKWSIDNFSSFWEEAWHYFGILHSKPYDKVYEKTGPGLLDCEWFSGARFNFAENNLRIRDDSTAIAYADEYGCEEKVTFAEMFEEVKLYAAAFKKNGLRKGDRIACYMSNRKESVFAYLAATSIGAIFGGPQPFVKSKPAANVISRMEAKFLLAIDHHSYEGLEYHNIDNLPDIADSVECLEKVIIVATRPETLSRDLSKIKNSCLLEDFLNSGRAPDGTVPDLEFEQLPFNHPICLNFTSGTTGLPKGPVHSAGTIISLLCDICLSWNLNKGDVLFNFCAVGWGLLNFFMPCLSRGVTLFLYAGSPTYERQGSNIWDIFSKFKVTYAFMTPTLLDKFEKDNVVPKPQTNLDHLKILTIASSPAKPQNYLFVKNKVKEDVFACSQLGSSENFCMLSGFDLNSPTYAGEIQVPSLGIDIKCFDEEGKSVVNQRGEMVVATPTPSLPLYLWRDKDNRVLHDTYLSKYPGVWCPSDELWINPVTKGFIIHGRTDDTIKQYGYRFLSSDIYNIIHDLEEIQDYICVGQQKKGGESRAVLFIKMKNGYSFTEEFKKKVEDTIANAFWERFVPKLILEVKDIPYNLNGKRMEGTVRKILATNQVPELSTIRNPDCLKYYCDIPEIMNY